MTSVGIQCSIEIKYEGDHTDEGNDHSNPPSMRATCIQIYILHNVWAPWFDIVYTMTSVGIQCSIDIKYEGDHTDEGNDHSNTPSMRATYLDIHST